MPKKKKKEELSFEQQLAAHSGGQVLEDVGKCRYFMDTGNLALNYCTSGKFIGGGFPGGKITEVYGPPASSKSLLGYTVAGAVQRQGGFSIVLDCERAINPDFAMTAGHCDPSKIVVVHPFFIEECESKIINMIRFIREHKGDDVPIFFVWDSIGVAPCKREWSETELPEEYSQADFKRLVGANQQPGERAKRAGEMLRKVTPFLDEYNTTMFVINQTRQKIGVMFGSDETTAGGGNALPFYASTRVRTGAAKSIKDTKKKIPIGVSLKFTNKKNRSFTPFLSCENIPLYFNQGIDPLGGLLEALINAGRVEKVSNGNYKVLPEYAGGTEYSFKASATRGDVDEDVLKSCPAVVDAKDESEIKAYLEPFKAAMDLRNDPDLTEENLDDEAEDLAVKMSQM